MIWYWANSIPIARLEMSGWYFFAKTGTRTVTLTNRGETAIVFMIITTRINLFRHIKL